jgi:thioredoxin 1
MIFTVSDKTFGPAVLGSTRPILVDVWAPWCEPCLALDMEMTRLDNLYGEKIFIAKINYDENPGIQQALAYIKAESIPALLFYKVNAQAPMVLLGNYPMENIAKAFGIDKLK